MPYGSAMQGMGDGDKLQDGTHGHPSVKITITVPAPHYGGLVILGTHSYVSRQMTPATQQCCKA